jgi:hypothetical protein
MKKLILISSVACLTIFATIFMACNKINNINLNEKDAIISKLIQNNNELLNLFNDNLDKDNFDALKYKLSSVTTETEMNQVFDLFFLPETYCTLKEIITKNNIVSSKAKSLGISNEDIKKVMLRQSELGATNSNSKMTLSGYNNCIGYATSTAVIEIIACSFTGPLAPLCYAAAIWQQQTALANCWGSYNEP